MSAYREPSKPEDVGLLALEVRHRPKRNPMKTRTKGIILLFASILGTHALAASVWGRLGLEWTSGIFGGCGIVLGFIFGLAAIIDGPTIDKEPR